MKVMRWASVSVLALSLAFLSCNSDDDPASPVAEDTSTTEQDGVVDDDTSTPPEDTAGAEVVEGADEFATLISYLEGAGGDYINTAAPKIIGAADVMAEGLDNWTVLDVRTGDKYGPDTDGVWKKEPNGVKDFEDGHIEGAANVALADIVTYAEANLSKDDKVLVACYSGHNAGHAVLILNVLGYDASSLKFGMSGWHTDFDVWSSKTSSDFAGQLVVTADPGKDAAVDFPELDTGGETGPEILAARIDVLLEDGPMFISVADVMSAPDDYYIVNYWPENHYLEMGHIDGAHQYTPKSSLSSTADLATLPTDRPIVVYCYSGQHGSQVAAWLKILGYDARDLLYGANALMHDTMVAGKWPGAENGPAGFDYAGQAAPIDEFDTLITYLEGEGGDYLNTAAPKIIGASDVMAEGLDNWTILDMRTGDKYGPDTTGTWTMEPNGVADFDDGHIAGATMVGLPDIMAYAEANLSMGEKVLVACYTGHNAGHAVAILNLLGYDAYSLKFGMSSWNADFDLWSNKVSSNYSDMFVSNADPGKPAPAGFPVIETGEKTGPDILKARITNLVSSGTRFVGAADVIAALDDYYIVNYWPEADYLGMGHLPGAHQYTPKSSLAMTTKLGTLPTDKPIAVYCYSGQTGSQVAVYLSLLGYDAYDVTYGTNGMMYDAMTSHKWSGPGDYATVTE